jgi:glycosyltransferase involved in cell wall biosynthesis
MLAPSHPSWDPRVVQKEAATLARQGKQVAVLAQHTEGSEIPDGIEVLGVPPLSTSRWERLRALPKVFRMARAWRADVYHAHEVESLIVGILLKWTTGAKLIFDAHECFHYTAARYQRGRRARMTIALAKRLLKLLSRRADHVIVVSFSNEDFYRNECRCPNVSIVHNSPPSDTFKVQPKSVDGRLTVVHNSFLSRDRGLDTIIAALNLIHKNGRRVRFLNVGLMAAADQEELESAARTHDLEVEVTGWLDYATMGDQLNRGSIGLVAVQPTLNNMHTLHNKLFNYMSTGLAVIGPRGSDTERVLTDSECGLSVDMTNASELAEAIEKLLDNPGYTAQLGANGRAAIDSEYGWHLMDQKLARIYDDVLEA